MNKRTYAGGLLHSMLVAGLGLSAGVAAAETLDERYQQLETRIAELERQQAMVPDDSRIRVNGFMSAGASYVDNKDFSYDDGSSHIVGYKPDSVLGLQIEGKVNARVSAVLQLVARGQQDFKVGAEWAYIGYRPSDADELRIGRMRPTYFLLSEYLEVGYAYPWARPPAEVYRAVFPSSFEGLSWLHRFDAGSWQHDLQLSWGNNHVDALGEGGNVDTEDAFTLALGSTYGNWQFGLQATRAETTISNPLFDGLAAMGLIDPVDRDRVIYAALGAQYDDGRWLLMLEGTATDTDNKWVPNSLGAYATVGYRFGKWMPHLTYAGAQLTDDEDRNLAALAALCPVPGFCLDAASATPFPTDTLPRLVEKEQESVTLGVRYDFLPNAALKVDWTRVLDTHGTFGLLASNQRYGNLNPGVARPDEEMDIFRVVVDVTF